MIPHFLPFAELEVAAEGTKEEVMVAKFCVAPTKAHSEAAEVIRYNIRYGSIRSGCLFDAGWCTACKAHHGHGL